MEKVLAILFIVMLSVLASVGVMVYGWGLAPKNWWWIIGIGLFGQATLSMLMDTLKKD